MKVLIVILLIAAAAAQDPCKPSPPKNEKVVSVTSTSIYFTFEDPDDTAECPILLYKTSFDETPQGRFIGTTEGNQEYHANITDLLPATSYDIITTSISTHGVQSDPMKVTASTDPA